MCDPPENNSSMNLLIYISEKHLLTPLVLSTYLGLSEVSLHS